MCFVFIWEETATCATYSINWLVFITEMKSVYSAVRTGSLNTAVCASSLTIILLTWSIGWAPNNASRWQMVFNLSFKGLKWPGSEGDHSLPPSHPQPVPRSRMTGNKWYNHVPAHALLACTETNLRLSHHFFSCCNIFGTAISMRHKSEGPHCRCVVCKNAGCVRLMRELSDVFS